MEGGEGEDSELLREKSGRLHDQGSETDLL